MPANSISYVSGPDSTADFFFFSANGSRFLASACLFSFSNLILYFSCKRIIEKQLLVFAPWKVLEAEPNTSVTRLSELCCSFNWIQFTTGFEWFEGWSKTCLSVRLRIWELVRFWASLQDLQASSLVPQPQEPGLRPSTTDFDLLLPCIGKGCLGRVARGSALPKAFSRTVPCVPWGPTLPS